MVVPEPGWIDHNGHLNMAYYHVIFDRAVDAAFDAMDIGHAYVARTTYSFFTVEVHVCYLDEVRPTDEVRVRVRVIGHDEKRIHVFEEMENLTSGKIAATSETLLIHIDMEARRVAPFPPDVAARVAAGFSRQAHLPFPERAGRRIALKAKA